MRHSLSTPDRLLGAIDEALRAFAARPAAAHASPAHDLREPELDARGRRAAAALMRVNRAGELAAQALYSGQAVAARTAAVRTQLQAAATEERDHLAWCDARLEELGGRRSVLDPLWYAGSFCVGLMAGAAGDRASLGFIAETERQVEAHLNDHLGRLPAADTKSAAILRQMAQDETRHGTMARRAGGGELPPPARRMMAFGGELLRRVAYFL